MKQGALQALPVLKENGSRFDLVYVDPPFADDLYEPSLTALADSELLKNDAWVIVEHFHKTKLRETYGRLKSFKDRRLGDSCLSFFELKL